MKKESGLKRIYPPIPHVEYWIIRWIKPDNVFFIQFYAPALDMDIISKIWSYVAVDGLAYIPAEIFLSPFLYEIT